MHASDELVIIRGGGEIGSAIAHTFHERGRRVLILELENPLCVRSTVSFAAAMQNDSAIVEGTIACLLKSFPLNADRETMYSAFAPYFATNHIPVIVDPLGASIQALQPSILIDARHLATPHDTAIQQAHHVIGIGDSFVIGVHCHTAIVSTDGHHLGRQRTATSAPLYPVKVDAMATQQRYVIAPTHGRVWQLIQVGQTVQIGDRLGRVDQVPFYAHRDGVLRGVVDFHIQVNQGDVIAEIDDTIAPQHCFTFSGQALAIAHSVLKACL